MIIYVVLQIGASTWATNIGAPMFVGIAGAAASSGMAIIMFEWHVSIFIFLKHVSRNPHIHENVRLHTYVEK